MTNTVLQFKDFVFPFNPSQLTIRNSRNIKILALPFYGSYTQDLGPSVRVVSGTGAFIGNDCLSHFMKMDSFCKSDERGLLNIPGIEPFFAYIKSFDVTAKPQPDYLAYSFEFVEAPDFEQPAISSYSPGYHVVVQGETLWNIAEMYGTDAYTLIKLNPQIERPDTLVAGQRVTLA